MQTFLPYPDFAQSAQCLDRQRLGKQRVEVLQLLNALSGKSKGWVNHPACKMWRGCEVALAMYGVAVCNEWLSRGYKDTCKDKIMFLGVGCGRSLIYPVWLGNPAFHDSHKSNLLRKNEQYYSKYGWNVPNDLEYVWPESE